MPTMEIYLHDLNYKAREEYFEKFLNGEYPGDRNFLIAVIEEEEKPAAPEAPGETEEDHEHPKL